MTTQIKASPLLIEDLEAEAIRIRDGAIKDFKRLTQKHFGTRLICGKDVKPEAITWLWENWLAAGKFHLIAGQAGTGKTTLALSMAAIITRAGKWPDGSQAGAGNVLMWSGEDGLADSLLPRFMASGGDPSRLHFINGFADIDGDRNFDPATDVLDLIAKIEATSGVRLIVIDPIVSAVAGDSHKNAETRRGLQPLVDMAAKVGAAVIGITHFTKGSAGRDPTERVTGSLAFGALARLVMCTVKPAEEGASRRLVRSKSNIGPDGGGFEYELHMVPLPDGIEGQAVIWGEPVVGPAHKLLGEVEATDSRDRSATDEAAEWLRDILAGGQMKAADVQKEARQAGIGDKPLRAARERLGIKPQRSGFGSAGSWIWSLPGSCAIDAHQRPKVPTPGDRATMGNEGIYADRQVWEVEL